MDGSQINFEKVVKVAHSLLRIQDLDTLLECLLTEVRNLVYADAGSIYLVEGSKLRFSYTQNSTLQKKLQLGKKLIYSTFSIPINNKSIAGYVANTGISVNIQDAYNIDEFQPYSFDDSFDKASGYHTQSMLSVPIKISNGRPIGVIQLINSIGSDKIVRPFSFAEESTIQFFADNAALSIEHAQTMRAMILRINKMLELYGSDKTAQYKTRIASYAVEIYEVLARKKGVSEREIKHNCDALRMAAMLYDIGKISIPPSILAKKKGGLTAEEKNIFRRHTTCGASLFYPNFFSIFEELGQIIALDHHERWDGNGYPGHINIETAKPLPGYEKPDGTAYGKKGNEIPLFARIVAVAIRYGELLQRDSSDSKEEGLEEKINHAVRVITDESGKEFDPEVVGAFLECLESINSITIRYPD